MSDTLSTEEIDFLTKNLLNEPESKAKEEIETEEQALASLKRNGCGLESVPEELRTAEVCLEAVKSHGFALRYVPESLKTKELCREAFKADRHSSEDYCYGAYEFIPDAFKTAGQPKQTYHSAFEKAVVEIFIKEFKRIYYRIRFLTYAGRREGLLALDNYLIGGETKFVAGSLLELGVQLSIDAVEKAVIEEFIDSWIEVNCSGPLAYYERILTSVIKTGVLSIQAGENPTITQYKMVSKVPQNLIPDIYALEEEDDKFLCEN